MADKNPIILDDLEQIFKEDLPWEKFAGKTVLISGANGFLASYIVKFLLFLNDKQLFEPVHIIAVSRNKENALTRFSTLLQRKDISLVINDISKPINIDKQVNFIIHAASQASPKYYGIDPVGTLEANTIGTMNLLRLGKEKKIETFLYFSSSEIYGAVDPSIEFIDEDITGKVDPMDVRSCYAESKRMGENMCISFERQYGISAKIVRPFHTYGPGLSLTDGRVFSDFISNIVNNQDIRMNSDGSAIRSFCYLRDATAGFFHVLLKGKTGNAYNIANPAGETTIKDLATTLVNLYPEKNLKAIFAPSTNNGYMPSSFKKLTPSIEKAKSLGWTPSTSIKEGFFRTIESITEH